MINKSQYCENLVYSKDIFVCEIYSNESSQSLRVGENIQGGPVTGHTSVVFPEMMDSIFS